MALFALQLAGCSGQAGQNLDAQVAIAEAAEQSVRDLDWATYATFVHPDELAKAREMMMPMIDAMSPAAEFLTEADTLNFFDTKYSLVELKTVSDERNHV